MALLHPDFFQSIVPAVPCVTDSDRGSEKVSWNEPRESLTPLEQANQRQTPAATSTSQPQEKRRMAGISRSILRWRELLFLGLVLRVLPSPPAIP